MPAADARSNSEPTLTERNGALLDAATDGDTDRVVALLAAGADVAHVDPVHGSQALAWAASAGHADIVRLLLEAGAEPDHRNVHGRSAAGLALDNGFAEIATTIDGAG